MARQRTVRPEFFRDRKIAQLGPVPALVYQALWCLADDGGVARCDPDMVYGEMFLRWPNFTVNSVTDALERLREASRITPYVVGDDWFCEIPNFTHHQNINNPSKFRYPRGGTPLASFFGEPKPVTLHEGYVSPTPPIPIPIPIPEKKKKRLTSPAATWLTPFLDCWVSECGGVSPAPGRMGKALSPLWKAHGTETVVSRLRFYLQQSNGKSSPEHFAQTFGKWEPKDDPLNQRSVYASDFDA